MADDTCQTSSQPFQHLSDKCLSGASWVQVVVHPRKNADPVPACSDDSNPWRALNGFVGFLPKHEANGRPRTLKR